MNRSEIHTALRPRPEQPGLDQTVVIEIFKPGTVGPTPVVGIKHIHYGIDWNHGKILLEPDIHLTTLTSEEVAAITESAAGGTSWHALQLHRRTMDKLMAAQREIDILRREVARLGGA